MRSMVRKAAKLAVYDESMIRAKNHHIPVTRRVETALRDEQVSNTSSISSNNDSLGQNVGSLTHNGAHSQPGAVEQVPNILHFLWILVARMRVLPVVGSHSRRGEDEGR